MGRCPHWHPGQSGPRPRLCRGNDDCSRGDCHFWHPRDDADVEVETVQEKKAHVPLRCKHGLKCHGLKSGRCPHWHPGQPGPRPLRCRGNDECSRWDCHFWHSRDDVEG